MKNPTATATWEYAPRQVWDAPLPLRIWHLASLDAPTVAVAWVLGFAWAGHVRLPAWSPVLVALVAWAVYIGDRLLDARAGMTSPPRHVLRERHLFHWRHRRLMLTTAIACTGLATWIVFVLLPARLVKPDTVAAATALAYFSSVHFRKPFPALLECLLRPFQAREFVVGSLFTTACVLPVWSRFGASMIHSALILPTILLASVAWLNCRAIGQWESDPDVLLLDKVIPWAKNTGLLALAIAVPVCFFNPRPAALLACGALSALLLGALDRMRQHITPLALRASADLVLLTPLLLLPLSNLIR